MKTALWFQGYNHNYPGYIVVWTLLPDSDEIENHLFENKPGVSKDIRDWIEEQSHYFVKAAAFSQLTNTLEQRLITRKMYRNTQERKQRQSIREDLELMRRSRSGMFNLRRMEGYP